MIELKDELFAVPVNEWQHVPFTVNRHKWWLRWYRVDEGIFSSHLSPRRKDVTPFLPSAARTDMGE